MSETNEDKIVPMWVSHRTDPKQLAGAISNILIDPTRFVQLQSIGAGALNQAVKAVCIVRKHMGDVVARPEFAELKVGDAERTAVYTIVGFA